MTEGQLDAAYTALAEAITRVGREKSELFLATLALDLLSQQTDLDQGMKLISQAERLAQC